LHFVVGLGLRYRDPADLSEILLRRGFTREAMRRPAARRRSCARLYRNYAHFVQQTSCMRSVSGGCDTEYLAAMDTIRNLKNKMH